MRKRILALLTACLLALALAACGGTPAPAPAAEGETPSGGESAVTKETLKVGLVLIGDEASAYDLNHIEGIQTAAANLGLAESQIILKSNVSENADCETAILELVESGCQIIFANSFGHENYMVKVAADHPEVQFCHATGYQSAIDDLSNTHNFFARIHEARYLAGVVAGLKTQTNKLGYVAAKDYAEVISGYTAYYLGAKSVNPDVSMYVNYTQEWSDPSKEATNAKALIDLGCDVISQHSDTSAPATTAEAEGVWAVGYNADMIPAAPTAALVSARINWSVYYEEALATLLAGGEIPQDWCKGLAENAVYLSPLNEAQVADGTAEAVQAATDTILDGTNHIFDGPLTGVDGTELVPAGEYFHESEASSAPSWDSILEGINVFS